MQFPVGYDESYQIDCPAQAGSGVATPRLSDTCLHLGAVKSHMTFTRLTVACIL